MDPETIAFLKRIARSMMVAFIWLSLLCIFALTGDSAFVNGAIALKNILFYSWAVISTIALVVILKKMWKAQVDLRR